MTTKLQKATLKLNTALEAAKNLVQALERKGDFLEDTISFQVITDNESDPHNIAVLRVRVDRYGVHLAELRDRDEFTFTWSDLLKIENAQQYIRQLDADIEELKDERRVETDTLKFENPAG